MSAVRKKIDPSTRDMFDAEVDVPEHDKVLTTLFQHPTALQDLLREMHALPDALPPFHESSTFTLIDDRPHGTVETVGLERAITLTGTAPSWSSPSPIRIRSKVLELPVQWSSERGSYSRIVGFCDIGLTYSLIKWPNIVRNTSGAYEWQGEGEDFNALVEVKAQWPTEGNLIRQLNLYRYSDPIGFKNKRKYLVVGPDDSVNQLVCEHQYRLATFSQTLDSFDLAPDLRTTAPRVEGQF